MMILLELAQADYAACARAVTWFRGMLRDAFLSGTAEPICDTIGVWVGQLVPMLQRCELPAAATQLSYIGWLYVIQRLRRPHPDAAVDWLFREDVLIPIPRKLPREGKGRPYQLGRERVPGSVRSAAEQIPGTWQIRSESGQQPAAGTGRSRSNPRPGRTGSQSPCPGTGRPAGSPAARCPRSLPQKPNRKAAQAPQEVPPFLHRKNRQHLPPRQNSIRP